MSLLSWTFLSEIAPVGTCPQLPACRNGMNMAGMFSLPSVRGQNLSASINTVDGRNPAPARAYWTIRL